MTEIEESWKFFHRQIDERLDAIRPKRAGVGETEWREPVYAWARQHMPDESNLVRNIAKSEVDRREGAATKRGNKLLRDYAKGIIPLSWAMFGPMPIKVDRTLRVRLDAATPDDVDDAARELRSDAKRVFDEVTILADGMEDLARMARRRGLPFVASLGDLPAVDGDSSGEEPGDGDPFGEDDDDE
jgi:hypothetical protein